MRMAGRLFIDARIKKRIQQEIKRNNCFLSERRYRIIGKKNRNSGHKNPNDIQHMMRSLKRRILSIKEFRQQRLTQYKKAAT